MSTKQSDKQPMKHENCVTEDRINSRVSAKSLVKRHNEAVKGKVFEHIPIFRGFILKEIKDERN